MKVVVGDEESREEGEEGVLLFVTRGGKKKLESGDEERDVVLRLLSRSQEGLLAESLLLVLS